MIFDLHWSMALWSMDKLTHEPAFVIFLSEEQLSYNAMREINWFEICIKLFGYIYTKAQQLTHEFRFPAGTFVVLRVYPEVFLCSFSSSKYTVTFISLIFIKYHDSVKLGTIFIHFLWNFICIINTETTRVKYLWLKLLMNLTMDLPSDIRYRPSHDSHQSENKISIDSFSREKIKINDKANKMKKCQ